MGYEFTFLMDVYLIVKVLVNKCGVCCVLVCVNCIISLEVV